MQDALTQMLTLQRDLQVRSFGADPMTMSDEERVDYIRWNVLALTDELHEFLGEVGWKPWATSRHVNAEAALSELVDAWHFMMNLLLALGEPLAASHEATLARDFANRYFEKREVNARRQAEGYDGVTGKCGRCRRDLEESDCTTERCVEEPK